MNVTGSATLHAPVQAVWDALHDPAVLVATIPGCRQLDETGPDAYRMTVSAGVAAIKGTYLGDVRLTDSQPPESFVLRASGRGGPGTVDADVTVTLAGQDDGHTRLDYDADAAVGGAVGGVGQRMLTGVARKTAAEFFAAVDAVLTGAAAPAPTAGAPGGAAAPEAPVPVGGGAAGTDAAAGEPARTFRAPGRPGGGAPFGAGFAQGASFGAGVALAGVLVGWLLGRHPRR